jgi:hypothetical protein
MNQRVERGSGKRFAENLEALLTPTHSGQPVVHERNAQSSELGRNHHGLSFSRDAHICAQFGPLFARIPAPDAGVHAGLLYV